MPDHFSSLNRRNFLVSSGLCLASLCTGCAGINRFKNSKEKKNIIFIFTDDQRWDAIGYANPVLHTPNLDSFSAQGLRFNNAFITLPVCSPARATAVTGRYTKANGVTTYHNPMNEQEVGFARYFNEAGYITGHVGKWHIPEKGPRAFEFQIVRQLGNGAPYWNPSVLEDGKRRQYEGYSTDYCAEQTIDIIKTSQQQEKPFCIWLCTQAPHDRSVDKGGNWLSDETKAIYNEQRLSQLPVPPNINDDLSGKPPYLKTFRARRNIMNIGPMTEQRYRDRQGYFGQITEMDKSLGKLFSALDDMNLRENTYVIFMSDNGLFLGEHGLMSKALHYEESIRVPMFAVGPGIPNGYEDSMVTNADIAPTILDLAGISIPGNMHGESLKNALLKQKPLDREYVLFELPDYNEMLETHPAYTIRSKRWKYIQTFENGKEKPYTFEELYDLENDPYEMSNLIEGFQDKKTLNQLRAKLEKLRTSYSI
jgi:arylsulfatase A-like enzyme